MIQRITIKNFLSFKDKVTLNFEATKDTTFNDCHTVKVAPNIRLLRFMMVMGANASGKSNLLLAFDFLFNFWNEYQVGVGEPTGVIPFCLDKQTKNKSSEFDVVFWANKKKYRYQLKISPKNVEREELSFYQKNKKFVLVDRSLDVNGHSVITINSITDKISDATKEAISLKCLNNISFFAARKQVNVSLPIIDDACDWVSNRIMPLIKPRSSMFEYAKEEFYKNNELQKYILDFLHRADFNISNINCNEVEQVVPDEVIDYIVKNPAVSKLDKEKLIKERTINQLKLSFQHYVDNKRGKEIYEMPSDWQSLGTRRIFGIETAIFNALTKNALLCIDELDSSIHPELLEFCIKNYIQNDSESQMLITTHYDPLLNTIGDLIRKDCVWFVEKKINGSTDLYSLADFNGEVEKYTPAYRVGRFGATPIL